MPRCLHMRGVMKTSLRLLHDAGIPVLYMLHDRWVLYERAGPWLRPWPTIDRAGFARSARRRAAGAAAHRARAPPIERQGINCFVHAVARGRAPSPRVAPPSRTVVSRGFDLERSATPRRRARRAPPRRLVFAGAVDMAQGLTRPCEHRGGRTRHKLVVAGPNR